MLNLHNEMYLRSNFLPKQGRIKHNTIGLIFHLFGCLTTSLFGKYGFIWEPWVFMFGLREKNIIFKLLPVYALYFFPFIECFLPRCFEWSNLHASKMSFQPEHGCWDLLYQHGGGHILIFTSKPFVDKQFMSTWCDLQSVPAPGFGSLVRSLHGDSLQHKFAPDLEKLKSRYTCCHHQAPVLLSVNMYAWASFANQSQVAESFLLGRATHPSTNPMTLAVNRKNINTFVHNKLSVSG